MVLFGGKLLYARHVMVLHTVRRVVVLGKKIVFIVMERGSVTNVVEQAITIHAKEQGNATYVAAIQNVRPVEVMADIALNVIAMANVLFVRAKDIFGLTCSCHRHP